MRCRSFHLARAQRMSEELLQLVRNAHELVNTGRWAEAETVWQAVHQQDKNNPQALFGLGFHAFHRNDLAAALRWLQLAVNVAPADVLTRLTLASVYGAKLDFEAELEAINAALVIDPYALTALIMKAGWFERNGRMIEAANTYRYALQISPKPTDWPESLRKQMQHGMGVLRQHNLQFSSHLNSRVKSLQKALPDSRQSQWLEAADLLAGLTKPYHAHCNQLHIPRLPAIPFYERAQFSWLEELEAATSIICRELEVLLAAHQDAFSPYIAYAPGQPINQWSALNHSDNWSALHLWRGGAEVTQNTALCPETAKILRSLELAEIPGLCPNVMFSALAPHTKIPPHHGETNARLVAHLPLVVPEDCGIRVGYEERSWKKGETLIFDDCLEHEAYNNSNELRVVLIFDLWNPLLSCQERLLVQEMTRAARDFVSI